MSRGSRGTSLTDVANAPVALLAAERERWLLWAPVLFGTGVGLYFAMPSEPPAWSGGAGSLLLVAGCVVARGRGAATVAALAAALLATGFAAAQLRTTVVAAPVLEDRYGPGPIAGTVVRLESLPRGPRVTLEDVELRGITDDLAPRRVRVALRREDSAGLGDRITVFGRLAPPGPPVAPDTYDFGRRAWFEGLGATGFAYGYSRPAASLADPGGWLSARIWLAARRHDIAERVRKAVPGEPGAVAAALMTGDRSAIAERTLETMRDSGLAHLLAISGLHLGLVAAILFFGVRTMLALSERLTLRRPIKKWAAAAAMAGSFVYLLLAGATIPTQRAFVMTGLVLLAVIVDREAISMRLVAWAAILILLTTPESLLSASFQMSFAAVVALVAFYEGARHRIREFATGVAAIAGGRVVLYVVGVAATTIIASAATGLIGLHHFGRIAVYGLPANLVAVPLTALWIMPWGVISAILMPLGLEDWGLVPMGFGIDLLLRVAASVSSWPGSVRPVPAMPITGLVLVTAGGLWLALWRQRWRYLGVIGVVAGVASIPLTPRPDILIADNGRLMAVRLADGSLALSDRLRERYAAKLWLEANGQSERLFWPELGRTADGRLSCDPLGCIYAANGHSVALVRDGRALAEECRREGILISVVPVRGRCPGPRVVIDRFDLWRAGAHEVWLESAGIRVRTVKDSRGDRPWSKWPDAD